MVQVPSLRYQVTDALKPWDSVVRGQGVQMLCLSMAGTVDNHCS